jgi:hypothetical protein
MGFSTAFPSRGAPKRHPQKTAPLLFMLPQTVLPFREEFVDGQVFADYFGDVSTFCAPPAASPRI